MDAMKFLKSVRSLAQVEPVYALIGDDEFLKRQCRHRLVSLLLSEDEQSLALSELTGEKLEWAGVRDDLDTPPFLGERRVVTVESADAFISGHREQLERYVERPSGVGVLILESTKKAMPSTAKLTKKLPASAKIECESPSENKPGALADWCGEWCRAAHGKSIDRDGAELLVERVGANLAQLDGELGKLAAAVTAESITAADVDRLISRTKSADVFRILDCLGSGRGPEAFAILNILLSEGEDPLAILGPLGYQLRKLAAVGRLVEMGQTLGGAMDAAGVTKYPVARYALERQFESLGPERVRALPDWLVEINLGLKGGNPLKPRMQLEMLLAKLA